MVLCQTDNSVPIYSIYLRTTFYWPAIFVYSAFYMLGPSNPAFAPRPAASQIRVKRRKVVAAILFVFLGGRAIWEGISSPGYGAWTGFGISYVNPVQEAEFLSELPLGARMYNIFDSGGYLLWRLFPQYKVMTDSRSFPYLDWFQDQFRFSMGEMFEEFLLKYPAEVAVIDLKNEATWRNFLKSPAWRPVFYGPTAIIFVKEARLPVVPQARVDAERFRDLKNAGSAFRVFRFAIITSDFKTAWTVLDVIQNKLFLQADRNLLAAAESYREAHRALGERDYGRAANLFRQALERFETGDRDRLIQTLLAAHERLLRSGNGDKLQSIERGLERLRADDGNG